MPKRNIFGIVLVVLAALACGSFWHFSTNRLQSEFSDGTAAGPGIGSSPLVNNPSSVVSNSAAVVSAQPNATAQRNGSDIDHVTQRKDAAGAKWGAEAKKDLVNGQEADPLAKFAVVEERLQDLGNGRQMHVALYRIGGRFPLIRRDHRLEKAADGSVTRRLWNEVVANHVILTASSMEERIRVEALLGGKGWTFGLKSDLNPWMVVNLPGQSLADLQRARELLAKTIPASVKVTEDAVMRPSVIPNDPAYLDGTLWALPKIQANRAWDIADGSGEVVVGVIDTGFDYTHSDLASNMWVNPLEIPDNNLDDDGNGKTNDIFGWNFYTGTTNVDNNAQSHGTHVAGTVAAVGFNSLGVIGVVPRAKIIACRVADESGNSSSSLCDAALEYLTALRNRGEHVVACNTSMGGTSGGYSLGGSVFDQYACESGIVSAHSSGNDYFNEANNPLRDPWTPFILYVANSTKTDTRWASSNVGFSWCDLAAPGESILSTMPGNAWGYKTGTSMSSPHVAGAAAMVASANPSLNAVQVMHIITNSTDAVSAFTGLVTSGGRLNVYKAVQMAKTYPDVALLAPVQGGTLVQSQQATLVANVQIASNSVTAVRFYQGGTTLIGTDNSAAGGWACNWTPDSIGTHDITCEADDSAGHTTKTWWRTRVTVAASAPANPVVSISAVDDFAAEPGNHAKLVVQLSSASASNITVPLTVSGTAAAGVDYVALPSSVVVTAGSLAVELPVTVTNDFFEESIETVVVSLGSGAGYTVGSDSNATVWIHDDESEAQPVIVADPVSVAAEVGGAVNFSVVAGGKMPLGYQWKKNSVTIPGATSNNYAISSVVPGDVGGYSCLVTNAYGAATSAAANLTLKPLSTMPASGFTPSSAQLNALLNVSNMTLNLYACWNTVNGGTNLTQWTNSAYVGSWTSANTSNVSFTASGLQVDTLYYFTFCHTNGADRTWSRVLTFRTMGAVAVENSGGASGSVPGIAQLNGALTAGGSADIRAYWGASDGGTNTAAWGNVATQNGVLQGPFSANVSNLLYGLTYYYRCNASNNLGSAWAPASTSFTSRLGSFSENFDGVTAPGLPVGWTTVGTANWITTTASNDTPPNAAFTPDLGGISTNSLISPVFGYVSGMGPLSFRHSFICEGTTTAYDGCVLEVKIGANAWQDVIAAGGSWVTGGYTHTIKTGYQNPLAGRSAWGISSGGFITTKVNLPASASGQEIQLRWLIGTDSSGSSVGWYVDTVGFSDNPGVLRVNPTSADGVMDNSATLNGTLSCSGAVLSAYAYWGTVNGGTNAASWEGNAYVGSGTNQLSANLSKLVSGLNPSTTYYFTLRGSNACEQVWATNVLSFTTTGLPSGPAVTNGSGATALSASTARLTGALTAGLAADVYIYWGATDGGMGKGSWANSVLLPGTAQGAFSNVVSNLFYGLTYYYRCYASNSVDSAWAAGSARFTTMAPAGGSTEVTGWSYTNWSSDANSGLTNSLTYLVAVNFGGSAVTVNGVSFGASALSGANFTIGGALGTFNNDANNVAGGSAGLAKDFIYNGTPRTIALTNLVAGNRYKVTLFTVGFEAAGSRIQTFASGSDSAVIDQDAYGDNNGNRISYVFDADASGSRTISVTPNSGNSFHMYALAACVLPAGTIKMLTNSPATGVDVNSAVVNGSISCSGSVYNVYAHWNTANGGTNAAAWTNCAYAGSWTNVSSASISNLVSGLNPGTTYYFTLRGSNACEQVWATNVLSFTTLTGGVATKTLQVISPYGSAYPAVGTLSTNVGSTMTCSVLNSPIVNGTTQYLCKGWTMTGNAPVIGTGTNFTMTITNNAVLTWQWTTNYWIELSVIGN